MTVLEAVCIEVQRTFKSMHRDDAILVTGGTGLVGSYILRYLRALGFSNIRASKRAHSDLSLVRDCASDIEWVECDLQDVHGVYDLVKGRTHIIHCAALISFDPRDAEALYQANVEVTATLCNAALDQDANRFVHISSIAAFARDPRQAIIDENNEWKETSLTSNYARSKFLAEMEVWRAAHEGLSTLILNPSLILGAGFWISGSSELISKVAKGLRFSPAGSTGIVDVRDVARAALLALSEPVDQERIIINAANWSYSDIFRQLATALQSKPPSMVLTPWMQKLALPVAMIGSWFGGRSNISAESIRTSSQQFGYSNLKSKRLLSFTYHDPEKSIREIGKAYLQSVAQQDSFGCLQLNGLDELFGRLFA